MIECTIKMGRKYEEYARSYEMRYHPWKEADPEELNKNRSSDIVAGAGPGASFWDGLY